MVRTLVLCLLICTAAFAGSGQPDSLTGPAPLDQFLREAFERNPTILAARHRFAASAARVRQSGTLADPELTYMREQMPDFDWSASFMQRVGLWQSIRFPGKLSAESDIARADETLHRYGEAETVNGVLSQVKAAYYRWWYYQQAQVLWNENLKILRRVADIARTRFATGTAMLQDALKAEIEISRAESELVSLAQRERAAATLLASLVDRPLDDPLGRAQLTGLPPRTIPPDSLSLLALRLRPRLLSDSLLVEEGSLALSLARREYWPDLKVGVEYVSIPSQAVYAWNLSAGISIPFSPWTLGKAGGRVEQAEAEVRQARESYRASRLEVLSDVQAGTARLESARDRESRYRRSILPQSREALQAGITAYQTGKSDILDILDSYRTTVDVSLEHLSSRVEFEEALADLERTVGSTVTIASVQ